MNRREFAKVSALTAAASRLPERAQTPAAKPVGMAFVGLGTISGIFMEACSKLPGIHIAGLVTGHPVEKGAKYSAMYAVPFTSIYTYETFDHIRDNPAIDAVYIGLPNSMHCEYTVRAAQAGKHVFCEKPMGISSAECRTMIDACHKAGVKLNIGYRLQQEPLWLQVAALIKAGRIGQLKSFRGGFFGLPRSGAWRLQRKMSGGGSLMDLGIYPLNTIRFLTGEEPTTFAATTSTQDHTGRFAEVEESLEWIIRFPSGILATAGSSYSQSGPSFLRIQGDQGYLVMQTAFNTGGLHLTGQLGDGDNPEKIDIAASGEGWYQFTQEARTFAAAVRNNTPVKSPGEDGFHDLLAIEAIYKAAGTPIA
jgi:predicted dehydrogenase